MARNSSGSNWRRNYRYGQNNTARSRRARYEEEYELPF